MKRISQALHVLQGTLHTMLLEFKIPEVGENITTGTIVSVLVSVGDSVKRDQNLLELETDKATIPVPSPVDGVIKAILIKEGQDVKVGQVVIKIEATSSIKAAPLASTPKPSAGAQPKATSPSKSQTYSSPTQTTTTPNQPTAPSKPLSELHVVVIGSGPGGYPAAFHAADMGIKVTLIDERENPGGVCVYVGCIPSKALLHAAKVLSEAREAKEIGLEFTEPKIDLDKLRDWKNKVVTQLTGGTKQLTKARNIRHIQGRATFLNSTSVSVKKTDGGDETISFDQAIIATGSHPISVPAWPKSERIIDSTGALELKNIPQSMLLVGGGVIGLELGTVYAHLGSELDVVEMLPVLINGADRDIVRVLENRLKEILKNIYLETKVVSMQEKKTGILVKFESKDGKIFEKEYEKVLVAIGRRPNTQNIGLEKTKVTLTDKGFIKVNALMQTTDSNIFAIGDVAGNPMLAHKASHEGIVAAGVIAGERHAFEPKAIPAVVYTDPEIAWCGLTEGEAKEKGIAVEVAKFPWGASGRAISMHRTDGLTKLIFDAKTGIVLGMAVVGAGAGELIAEGVLAVEMAATAEDLKLSIHPHPTLTETVMESAEMFFGPSTHVYKKKK